MWAASVLRRLGSRGVGTGVTLLARLLTGAQSRWIGCQPADIRRIDYANHASHGDFVLIWSSLPPALRSRTRPVAGSDYWDRDALRRFVIRDVFNAVLIDREAGARGADPVGAMAAALATGNSLILFPEGTRNTTDERLLPFKSGIFHLAMRCPQVELVPVWIENLNRVLPKGAFLPAPLICSLVFGESLHRLTDEPRDEFLARARAALLALAPDND